MSTLTTTTGQKAMKQRGAPTVHVFVRLHFTTRLRHVTLCQCFRSSSIKDDNMHAVNDLRFLETLPYTPATTNQQSSF